MPTVVTLAPNAEVIWASSADMKEVRDGAVALVLTSPPYWPEHLTERLTSGGIKAGEFDDICADIQRYAYSLRPVFQEIDRILKPSGTCVIQTRDIRIAGALVNVESIHRELCESVGLKLVARHYWRPQFTKKNRVSSREAMIRRGVQLPHDAETFMVFKRLNSLEIQHDAKPMNEALLADFNVSHKGGMSKPHPHQSPLNMLEAFIETYSNPMDLIVDPFAGGASTLKVALKLGRNAIGYEISNEHLDRARHNLASTLGEKAVCR